MKNTNRLIPAFVIFFLAATAFAAPPIKVTVFEGPNKVAFTGTTSDDGTFTTGALRGGQYIVQFNATTSSINGGPYGLVISSGKKKVVADSVVGEKFLGGGVAMRIEVGSGSRITGQIGPGLTVRIDPVTGKKLVWIPQKLGSHLPAHWALEDSPDAKETLTFTTMSRQDLQNRQNQGVGLR